MFQEILYFYLQHGLYQSNYDYQDKIKNLVFFYQYDRIRIEQIHDYCTMRQLKGVKNSTINRELTLMRSSINYYNKHHDEQIPNPFNGFSLFEADYMPRYLNELECSRLLKSALQHDNIKLWAFIQLSLNTGSRAGELTKLKWENVHKQEGYMTIRNTLSKNRKTVHKPLNARALLALDKVNNNSEWVFYNPNTGKNIRSFRRGFELAVERANLGHVRMHDLRHTFASLLVREGVPLYHVSQLLGHSDTRITQRYAHLSPNSLAGVLDKLPDF